MKKKVWIMNHYAGSMFFNEGGRHYWFAKELKAQGYEPTVFCCNTKHSTQGAVFFEDNSKWSVHESSCGAPFVFVSSSIYTGNGVSRIKNMITFALNLVKCAKQYAKQYEKPDIILASSVHPLTVLAGEYLARYFKVPCICEIRDLWPESIFAYYPKKRKAWYAKLLLAGEKKMYKDADAIVMTWAGGPQYIKDMGWNDVIDENKVHHICNGVDLDAFKENIRTFPYEDEELSNPNIFKAVYAGSIRHVNKIHTLVDVAKILEKQGNPHNIKLLVWGSGDKVDEINKAIEENNLSCIKLKGRVPKQYIPSILSQSDCCILHNATTVLDKFGQSQNKFFEYLASGKPLLMTYSVGYSICEKYNCGIQLEEQTPENIAAALNKISQMALEERKQMSENSLRATGDYNFKKHTNTLIDIIENL